MPDDITRLSHEMARDPSSMVWVALADALRRAQRPGDAERTALRGLERHPYHADGHDVLARIFADRQDVSRAHDEWEMALRLDSRHVSALLGLGWLAFRGGDVVGAERHLRAAQALAPDDGRVGQAIGRLTSATLAPSALSGACDVPGASAPEASTPSPAAVARALFHDIEAAGAVAALLVDHDGLVLGGRAPGGTVASDALAAELCAVSADASQAIRQLQIGQWESLVIECEGATLAVAPGPRDSVILVATLPEMPAGLTRLVLERARRRADGWLEAL